MSVIHRIRGKFDEAYRIEHGWGLSPIRSDRELKALIKFCRKELEDVERMNLNIQRCDVYVRTVDMYESGDRHLHEYVNDNVGWYWS